VSFRQNMRYFVICGIPVMFLFPLLSLIHDRMGKEYGKRSEWKYDPFSPMFEKEYAGEAVKKVISFDPFVPCKLTVEWHPSSAVRFLFVDDGEGHVYCLDWWKKAERVESHPEPCRQMPSF